MQTLSQPIVSSMDPTRALSVKNILLNYLNGDSEVDRLQNLTRNIWKHLDNNK